MNIINDSLIMLNIEGNTKEDIIYQIATKLSEEDRLYDTEKYIESVYQREEEASTGIGFGIAIPHGKSSSVKHTSVVFARLQDEIDWESLDDEKVKLVFGIAVPAHKAGDEHLRIIANLSRKLIDESFRESLNDAEDNEAVMQLLEDILNNK